MLFFYISKNSNNEKARTQIIEVILTIKTINLNSRMQSCTVFSKTYMKNMLLYNKNALKRISFSSLINPCVYKSDI